MKLRLRLSDAGSSPATSTIVAKDSNAVQVAPDQRNLS